MKPRFESYHLLVIIETDSRPSLCVIRLDVESHLIALSDRLPTDEIFAVMLQS